MVDVKRQGLPTQILCDRCGSTMHIRWGKNGPFLSCSRYPECKNSKNFVRDSQGNVRAAENGEVRGTCELCGREMVVKEGRFGAFLACTGYPECKNTRSLGEQNKAEVGAEGQRTDKVCERCGGHFVVRRGRQGRAFLACENYPTCRSTSPITTGVRCPQAGCDGELVERTSKRGRVFYGCNRYPRCRFVVWSKPLAKACPQCGNPYLLSRVAKGGEEQEVCPVKSCGYREERQPGGKA
jgi:DNA topoisomerase I